MDPIPKRLVCEGVSFLALFQHDEENKEKRVHMKVSRIFKSLLLSQTLLIATSVLAANANNGALKVSAPVSVNGTTLAIGDYQVNWEGTGADVEVNISKSNKVIVTLPGHLIELDRPAHDSSYTTNQSEDGSATLIEIDFRGKKYKLAVGQDAAASVSMKAGAEN
jgi:hypothetical protein